MAWHILSTQVEVSVIFIQQCGVQKRHCRLREPWCEEKSAETWQEGAWSGGSSTVWERRRLAPVLQHVHIGLELELSPGQSGPLQGVRLGVMLSDFWQ